MAENNRIDPIELTDNETGTKYVLEFNREAVVFAEHNGFIFENVDKFPMTMVPDLFYYAFRMHHRNLSREKVDKIYDAMGGLGGLPEGFLARLGVLYMQAFETLTDEVNEENPRISVKM